MEKKEVLHHLFLSLWWGCHNCSRRKRRSASSVDRHQSFTVLSTGAHIRNAPDRKLDSWLWRERKRLTLDCLCEKKGVSRWAMWWRKNVKTEEGEELNRETKKPRPSENSTEVKLTPQHTRTRITPHSSTYIQTTKSISIRTAQSLHVYISMFT